MKNTLLIIFITVLNGFCCNIYAQKQDYPEFVNDLSVGANLGFSVPSMRYSGQIYDIYDKSSLFSGLGGLFVDWNFYDNWSLRPHLNFTGRGVRMKYSPQYIDYKLKATYFDIRIPVVYSFDINHKIRPYVAAGPSLNFVAGGRARYTSGSGSRQEYELKLNKSNFKGFDFGLFLGAGATYPVVIKGYSMVVGAEIGYNFGMLDTFSKAERRKDAIAVNIPEYTIEGSRKNNNLSISVNVSIPLKSLFGKKKKSRKQSVQAPAPYVAPKVEERKVTVQEKQCCSLDEMYEFILNGQDISTKKICAFSDIKFDFDKATIRPESQEFLDKFVTILKKFPSICLSIIGHTDNVGDSQYNLVLSKKRAEAVAAYLVRNGIEQDRLRCFGYGARQPLTDNSSSAARAMNRRVEFDIIDGAF